MFVHMYIQILELLRRIEIIIVPVANPDGYHVSCFEYTSILVYTFTCGGIYHNIMYAQCSRIYPVTMTI